MKVCIFLPSLELGGAERRMVLLAEQLNNKGHAVELCTLRQTGFFVEQVKLLDIPMYSTDKGGRYDLLMPFFKLLKYFKRQNYDVVLSCLPSANLFALTSKIVLPHVPLVWGLASAELSMRDYGLWARISYYVQMLFSRITNKIVVNSFAGKKSAINKGYSADNIQVIYNGVDTQKFSYSQSKAKAWRKLHGIPQNAPLIGIVGRLDPAKDYDTFFEACKIARELNNKLWFVIVGGGEDDYAKSVLSNIQQHPLYGKCLVHLAHESDVSAAYSAFDVATITSKSESLPNVLVEALACGRLAVVTDVGDCKHVLSSFGEVCNVGDAHAIANSWLSVLQRVNKKSLANSEPLKNELQQYINHNFSVDKMIQEFEALCELLIKQQVGR